MKDNEYFGLTCEALCEGLAALLHGCEEDGIDFYVSWSYGECGKGRYTIRKHINVILSDAITMLKNQHEGIERLKKEQEEKAGKWIPVTNGRGGMECSICHDYAPSYQNGTEYLSTYCPNCGAKMEGR